MSCTGAADAGSGKATDSLSTPRMFHHSVRVGSDVFIFGGFDTYTPTDTPPSLQASSTTIALYDSSRGSFRTLDSTLGSPHGMSHALVLDGGSHILILGGTTRAEFSQSPPLRWSDVDAPLIPNEAIAVQSETVVPVSLNLVNVPYSAAAVSAAGQDFVLVGGRTAEGQPSDAVTWVTGDANAVIDGTASVKNGSLSYERMGATAHFLPGDSAVLVIGGAVNSDVAAVAEVLVDGPTSTPIELIQSTSQPFALHASTRVSSDDCQHVFALAGGVDLQRADPDEPRFLTPSASSPRVALLHLDLCSPMTPVGRLQDVSTVLAGAVRTRRVFHRLNSLDGGALMLSGGYNQVGQPVAPVSDDCDTATADTGCWLSDVAILQTDGTFDALGVSELFRGSMSAARFGHGTVSLPDGAVLFTGGMRQLAIDPQSISSASELYNPLLPVDSARCN